MHEDVAVAGSPLGERAARPWLPWVAAGLVLGCALDPDLAWPLGLVSALAAVAAVVIPGDAWWWLRRASLALLALWVGSRLAPEPPQLPVLAEVSGEVTRTYPGRFEQRLRLRVAEGLSAPSVLFVDAPLWPGVRPGDRVRVAGLLYEEFADGETWRRFAASELAVLARRDERFAGASWDAVERLPRHRELATSLLLGRGSPPERNDFHRSGLMHLLAVSGLHLGLALAAVALLVRLLGLPWRSGHAALAVVAGGYLFFTGAAIPTQRATAMAGAWLAGRLLGRRLHRLAALSLAAIVLVLVHPEDARSAGFQLTLVAVAGIVTLGVDLMRLRRRELPLRAWPLDRPSWRLLLWLGRWSLDGLAVGVAASLAVAPVIAWHFGEFQSYSAFASLLATPLLALVLGAGLIYLALASLWPGGPWEGLVVLIDGGLHRLAEFAAAVAALPGASVSVSRPEAWFLLLWAGVFLPLRDRWDLLLRSGAAALLLAWLLLA